MFESIIKEFALDLMLIFIFLLACLPTDYSGLVIFVVIYIIAHIINYFRKSTEQRLMLDIKDLAELLHIYQKIYLKNGSKVKQLNYKQSNVKISINWRDVNE